MSPDDNNRDEELEDEPYVKADHRASREGEAEPSAQPDAEPPSADEAAAEEPEPPPAESPPSDEPAAEAEGPDINVYSLLRMSVGMFIEQAWIHMGLRMDPNKQKVEQNLPLAKIAIDTVIFLVEQLQPDLDEAEKKELELALANLRMNYVQRT